MNVSIRRQPNLGPPERDYRIRAKRRAQRPGHADAEASVRADSTSDRPGSGTADDATGAVRRSNRNLSETQQGQLGRGHAPAHPGFPVRADLRAVCSLLHAPAPTRARLRRMGRSTMCKRRVPSRAARAQPGSDGRSRCANLGVRAALYALCLGWTGLRVRACVCADLQA